jgi:transposase
MDKKSKDISGLKSEKNKIKKPKKYFKESEKHQIIQELLNSGCSKRKIWKKYTGQEEERGHLLRWMRQLGYDTSVRPRRPNFTATNNALMAKKIGLEEKTIDDFETLQLKKRIAELENQLKDAEMKAIAYSTMVDIAEKEFKIPIRKKYNTKPSKK